MGAEARHFDVITQQVRIARDAVDFAAEELFLIIETGAPGEVGAHLQVFPNTMPEHVGRMHTLGGFHIMCATGGVDVMVAGPPARFGRVDPALDLEGGAFQFGSHHQFLSAGDRFGSARKLDLVGAFRQAQNLAILTVDLGMK